MYIPNNNNWRKTDISKHVLMTCLESEIKSENNSNINWSSSSIYKHTNKLFFSLVKPIFINMFNTKSEWLFHVKSGTFIAIATILSHTFIKKKNSIHISMNFLSPPSYTAPDITPHWCIIDCFIPVHQKVISRHPISWSTWHKVQWNP